MNQWKAGLSRCAATMVVTAPALAIDATQAIVEQAGEYAEVVALREYDRVQLAALQILCLQLA